MRHSTNCKRPCETIAEHRTEAGFCVGTACVLRDAGETSDSDIRAVRVYSNPNAKKLSVATLGEGMDTHIIPRQAKNKC